MTDIEIARAHLDGHSICLCKNGSYFIDDGRGISPMIRFLEEERDLRDYAVADIIVGKAVALLFIKAGIREVYGEIMSRAGFDILQQYAIPCAYGTLTEKIISRKGDDICPMEQTVAHIDDPEEGYTALKTRLSELQKGAKHV